MAECAHCTAPSDAYLCGVCQRELRDMLTGLCVGQKLSNGRRAAGFIEFLEDAALGRTRLGESARRSTDLAGPAPVHLTDNKDDSFKGSPSELLGNIHDMLIRWVEVVNQGTETLEAR